MEQPQLLEQQNQKNEQESIQAQQMQFTGEVAIQGTQVQENLSAAGDARWDAAAKQHEGEDNYFAAQDNALRDAAHLMEDADSRAVANLIFTNPDGFYNYAHDHRSNVEGPMLPPNMLFTAAATRLGFDSVESMRRA